MSRIGFISSLKCLVVWPPFVLDILNQSNFMTTGGAVVHQTSLNTIRESFTCGNIPSLQKDNIERTYVRRRQKVRDEGADGGSTRVRDEGADGGSTAHNSQQNNSRIDEIPTCSPAARSLSRNSSDCNYQQNNSPIDEIPTCSPAAQSLSRNSSDCNYQQNNSPIDEIPTCSPAARSLSRNSSDCNYPSGSTMGGSTSNMETLPHANRKKPRMEVTPRTLPTLGPRLHVPPALYSPKDSAMANKQAKQEEIRKRNKRKRANEKKLKSSLAEDEEEGCVPTLGLTMDVTQVESQRILTRRVGSRARKAPNRYKP